MKTSTWIYAGLLVLAGGWLTALLAAPRLMCSGYELGALVLYRVFALICHQQRERSFHWCGWPLAVCVRCTGIYFGALVGLLLYPFWYQLGTSHIPRRKYFIWVLILLALDWALGAADVVAHNTASRLVTGLLAGTVSAFYVLPALLVAMLPVQHKPDLS